MRKKITSYNCKVLYHDKYHGSEVQNELDTLEKEGWKIRFHYSEATSIIGNNVKSKQEVYWFDKNEHCHTGDADYRQSISKNNNLDDGLSDFSKSIAKEMTEGYLCKASYVLLEKKEFSKKTLIVTFIIIEK